MFKTPFLQFDFLNLNTDQREQKIFQNPIEILQTNEPKKVIDILNQVELAVNNGYYAAGFLSYEATEAFLPVNSFARDEFPLIWFGIFDKVSTQVPKKQNNFKVSNWMPEITQDEYNQAFDEIKNAFKLNQTKQVNYTLQLNAKFNGDSYAYYQTLKEKQNADYSCYLSLENVDILSLSPELFFDLKTDLITLKPMKGTKERGKNSFEDHVFKEELKNSTKDKLENQLIVDLMINELKTISNPNSIKVKKPFEISTFPTLFQMTSTIEAKLKPNKKLSDIFTPLFPCGSITGTPKIETINFINKLENRNRQIYCGTIGFITPKKEATFNVPIRTVSINKHNKQARYDVGGGITHLSNPHDEYNEAFTKAKILNDSGKDFDLIETFGLYQGNFIAYKAHLNRLKSSAEYFNFKIDIDYIDTKLKLLAKNNSSENLRIRLLVNSLGDITITSTPLIIDNEIKKVSLAKKPIDKNNIFLYHKTTNRDVYDDLKSDYKNSFDVILWNQNNEITEFTIGNLVIEYNNELITPPVSSGLLPGTYREILLENQTIKENIITKNMLQKATSIWLINSVRKWVKVQSKKDSI